MAANGHGISDAVRKSIREWMTDRVIDILYKEANSRGLLKTDCKLLFRSKLRSSEQWVRVNRKRSDKWGIWSRTYYSKLFGRNSVNLTVLTNRAKDGKPEDMYIERVTISLAGQLIGGGRVSVPSVRLSQWDRNATIEEFESNSLFSEFSEAELACLSAELEFGEDSVLALIEEERIV